MGSVHLQVCLTSGCGTVVVAHLLQIVVARLPVVASASLALVGLVGICLLLLMLLLLIRIHLCLCFQCLYEQYDMCSKFKKLFIYSAI